MVSAKLTFPDDVFSYYKISLDFGVSKNATYLRAQNYLHPNQINLFSRVNIIQVFKFFLLLLALQQKLKQLLPKKVGLKIDFSISRSLQYGPRLMEWDPKKPFKNVFVYVHLLQPHQSWKLLTLLCWKMPKWKKLCFNLKLQLDHKTVKKIYWKVKFEN